MNILTSTVKDVIEKTELVAIATYGENGPHLVATWGDFIRSLDINDGKTIIIPEALSQSFLQSVSYAFSLFPLPHLSEFHLYVHHYQNAE